MEMEEDNLKYAGNISVSLQAQVELNVYENIMQNMTVFSLGKPFNGSFHHLGSQERNRARNDKCNLFTRGIKESCRQLLR